MSTLLLFDECYSPGITTAKVWIKEGSRSDPPNKKGLHSLYSSLLTRGCGPYNNIEFSDIIEDCGAIIHCDTSQDGIMISLKCTEQKSKVILPLLNLMINSPHLDEKHICLEKKLALQTIKRQKENTFGVTFDNWRKIAYIRHPYEFNVIGDEKCINNITKKDIDTLSKDLITRQKTIVVAGNIPNEAKQALLDNNKIYENQVKSYKRKAKRYQTVSINKSIILHIEETSQVSMILGTPTISHSHKDDIILRIISCHLGVGMSSVLFRKLREERGLTYDVGIYHPITELEAPFVVHASSSKEKSLLTLKLLIKCWKDIQKKPLSEDEIFLAKAKFKGNLNHNSQTLSQRCERKAHLIGLNMNIEHDLYLLDRLNLITSEEILEKACDLLSKPFLSLLGPKELLEKLSELWSLY